VTQQDASSRSRQGLTPAQAFDMAVALHRQGRLAESAQVYRAILKLKPDHFGALQYLGTICTAQGNPQEAERLIRQALGHQPDSAEAHNNLGIALAALDRLDQALAEYEQAVTLDPRHLEARNNLGNALNALGRSNEAVAHFEHALALQPQSPEVLNNLGGALAALGRYQDALSSFRKAIALKPEFAEAHNNLGLTLVALQRPDEAMSEYRTAVALKPDYAEAHHNLANALAARSRHEAAITHFEKALALKPNAAEVLNDLGNAMATLDRHAEAIPHFEKACALRPSFAEAINNLGNALAALNRHDEALSCRRALAIRPDFAEAHGNLGNALEALSRQAEAIASYKAALALNDEQAEVHHNLGNLWSILGNAEESRCALETAVKLAPRKPEYYRSLAQTKHFTPGDPHLAAMEELARGDASFSAKDRIALHFGLGKAYADCGEHEKSFRHYLEGNALRRQQLHYDAAVTIANFDRIKAVFTPELIRQKRMFGNPSELPIFIFGMPRSGTSLVEQILASHGRVFGAGELEDLQRAVARLERAESGGIPFPELVPSMGEIEFHRLATDYLVPARALAPDAERITDKMPGNFVFAGFIHLALPNARMIHVRRDPLDTCLSCFTHEFMRGLEWSYDLTDLARHFRAYEALMEHWRRLLPERAMIEVQYEHLVADFETQTRRLLDFCGLDWDQRCLAFHETERPVRTASATQVRQPLYHRAVGRWRQYEPWLGPLLDALGPR
jgi:tetratricopeptide (TPR) repeat protein